MCLVSVSLSPSGNASGIQFYYCANPHIATLIFGNRDTLRIFIDTDNQRPPSLPPFFFVPILFYPIFPVIDVIAA